MIQSHATNPEIEELVAFLDDVRTFRISTNTLGTGYVECIGSTTLSAIRDSRPASIRGTAVMVPVLEGDGSARIGRFGWKSRHASLQSFSANAYLNKMGITNPLFPEENTSSGRFVGFGTPFDRVAEPEDDGEDLLAFADFMRSTKAPSLGPITAAVTAGEAIFRQVGCDGCHVSSITTAARALASMAVRSPFLRRSEVRSFTLIASSCCMTRQRRRNPNSAHSRVRGNGKSASYRSAFGSRTRNRLMHDGFTFTNQEAILRHAGQALASRNAYGALTDAQKTALLALLDSL